MDKQEFLLEVQKKAKLESINDAEEASKAVMHVLKRRITKNEEKDLKSQLSAGERDLWREEPEKISELEKIREKHGGVSKFNRDEFFTAVNEHSGNKFDARKITKAVFGVLKRQVSEGESQDVESQLPVDLKEIWEQS